MQRRLKLGVLYSRVRVEEKWIFAAMEKRGIDYERLDDRSISFDLENPEPWRAFDAVLERSISYTSGLYALRLLNSFGVPTVNTAAVAAHPIKANFLKQREPLLRLGLVLTSSF